LKKRIFPLKTMSLRFRGKPRPKPRTKPRAKARAKPKAKASAEFRPKPAPMSGPKAGSALKEIFQGKAFRGGPWRVSSGKSLQGFPSDFLSTPAKPRFSKDERFIHENEPYSIFVLLSKAAIRRIKKQSAENANPYTHISVDRDRRHCY